ncbi:MAG: hypothetical protein LBU79_07140 [Planctomycetota bacterium]|nr:hypothetical protein [Planctomycetota bacterium]
MAPTSIDDIKAESNMKGFVQGFVEGFVKVRVKIWLKEWLEGRLEEKLEGRLKERLKARLEERVEEKLRSTQNSIMTVLAVRFGPPPIPVKEKVLRCLDFNLLETMLVKSAEAKTMEEFNSHLS